MKARAIRQRLGQIFSKGKGGKVREEGIEWRVYDPAKPVSRDKKAIGKAKADAERQLQLFSDQFAGRMELGPPIATVPTPGKLPSNQGVSTLGLALTRDLRRSGFVYLRGRRVESVADIEALAQIWRNPHFETFGVIYFKGTEIRGHEAVRPEWVLEGDAQTSCSARQESLIR